MLTTTTEAPSGVSTNGDGISTNGDGSITNGDGTNTNGDGSTTNGDGTIVNGDGTTSNGDGTSTNEEVSDTRSGSQILTQHNTRSNVFNTINLDGFNILAFSTGIFNTCNSTEMRSFIDAFLKQ